MYTFLVVIQVIVAIGLIALVLLQHGKGADAGAAFGSGASGTVFGSRGSANFLSRATAYLAVVFFGISLALAYFVNTKSGVGASVVDSLPAAASEASAPAVGEQLPVPAPAAPAEDAKPKLPE
ncbi:preprotein translocase subunit SecG [Stagnimonas aquatica]|uniref:Protein-export membrane protein SecG n=1 Tax=Stagnimonas aquatica TaxID=2689987 RepID=A0A3N0VDN6_9GAMM|nr:preprotein translocase subunit SecG [Stagnimonas aquatica]